MTHADIIWIGAIAGLLAADIVLVAYGQPLLTDSAREHPMITGAIIGLVALHLLDALGPCDPFRAIGKLGSLVAARTGLGRR
jgi:hypothetical protein